MPVAVNTILLQRNRLIGYRIAEEELTGENRAEYGAKIIKSLQMIIQHLELYCVQRQMNIWKKFRVS